MSYLIFNNNGSLLTRIPAGQVNTSTTSLALIGRDVSGYGTYYNQNLITLLGNSANLTTLPPRAPITGQLWYDITYQKLKVYDGDFQTIGSAVVNNTKPLGQTPGEFWYDTTGKNLNFVDDNGQYNVVTSFPESHDSGWKAKTVTDDTIPTPAPKSVTILKQDGTTVGVISNSAFTASKTDSTTTFVLSGTSTFALVKGLSIIGNISSTGTVSSGMIKTDVYVTGTIPSAASAGAGARAFVSDATSLTFGTAYVGGSTNNAPVWSNGTGWFIG